MSRPWFTFVVTEKVFVFCWQLLIELVHIPHIARVHFQVVASQSTKTLHVHPEELWEWDKDSFIRELKQIDYSNFLEYHYNQQSQDGRD